MEISGFEKMIRLLFVLLLMSLDIFVYAANTYRSNTFQSPGYNGNYGGKGNWGSQRYNYNNQYGYGMPSYGPPPFYGYGNYGFPRVINQGYIPSPWYHPHSHGYPHYVHQTSQHYGQYALQHNIYGHPVYGNNYFYHGVPYGGYHPGHLYGHGAVHHPGNVFGRRRGFFDNDWWPLAVFGLGLAIPLLVRG